MNLVPLLNQAETACQRRAARWFGRRPFPIPAGPALVSFTFDDFPRSALITGGAILERFGAAGTYYTSLGLSGKIEPSGEMFDVDELPCLLDLGHELGCHTYSHCHAWDTPPETFEREVLRNITALKERMPYAEFRTLSYPKHRISNFFPCSRGGGQVFNVRTVDLNNLSAFFLEKSIHRPEAIRRLILENRAAGGWLIFATHDVAPTPTPFGVTPEFFRHIVQFTVDSGTQIMPVGQAWDTLLGRAQDT
jgi:peptidoglycan/xylan/chitin deacetylase (PgdA/CDA1 family)